jgi:UDP-N-acetylglucosamine:LPS N-acetylglucosamine transferase
VLGDDRATPELIAELAGSLLDDPATLSAMAAMAAALGRPDAAKSLAAVVLEAA